MDSEKIAFLFPGQGSQYVGMGLEFYQQFDTANDIFTQADEVLGYEISNLCFDGPLEKLSLTQHSQVSILTTTIACLQVLQQTNGVVPAYVAGHSLGEYSALVAAGALSFQSALKLVRQRAEFMQYQATQTPGGMAAILGLSIEDTNSLCQEIVFETKEILQPANFNSPGQVVISGQENSLNIACKLAIDKGAKRAIRLAVSGAFHSGLMLLAGERLAFVLEETDIKPPNIPVISNVTALPITDPHSIKEGLIKQISSPVLWQQSIEWLCEKGITTFIEIGPGKVLSGLIRRINPSVQIKNIQDINSLEGLTL